MPLCGAPRQDSLWMGHIPWLKKDAGVLRLEGVRGRLAGPHRAERGLWVGLRGVRVHRLRDTALVGQPELHRVSLPYEHDGPGDLIVEGPGDSDSIIADAHRRFRRAEMEACRARRGEGRQRRSEPMVRHAIGGSARRNVRAARPCVMQVRLETTIAITQPPIARPTTRHATAVLMYLRTRECTAHPPRTNRTAAATSRTPRMTLTRGSSAARCRDASAAGDPGVALAARGPNSRHPSTCSSTPARPARVDSEDHRSRVCRVVHKGGHRTIRMRTDRAGSQRLRVIDLHDAPFDSCRAVSTASCGAWRPGALSGGESASRHAAGGGRAVATWPRCALARTRLPLGEWHRTGWDRGGSRWRAFQDQCQRRSPG